LSSSHKRPNSIAAGIRKAIPAAIPLAIVAASLGLFFWAAPLVLPYGAQARLDALEFSKVFLDRDSGELQVLPLSSGLRRVFAPLDKMPRDLVEIVVKAEDRRFWFHPGVDPVGIVRAAWQNRSAGKTISGASTIGMQLSRLLRAGSRKDASRDGAKLLEAWEAMQLERRLGKRGALELYLNLVPFGQNVEGFPAAARAFFGKPLSQLTRSELLLLAVVPRSPNYYSPYANPANNRAAVLRLGLARDGADTLDAAYRRVLDPGRPDIWPFRTPQFIRWLASRPGIKDSDGRLPLRTGIESELQSYLENLLAQTVEEARPKRVSNAAALFVRPGDMTIAAWVGSVDFRDAEAQGQVDGVTMLRQPGSTLKPFLYSMALEQGFTASSVLPDIPTDFGGSEVYTPANFNDQFNGPVRLRQALASSLNVPAVYLLRRIGVGPFTDRLLSAGFSSLESQRGSLGLGLALGNAEVSLFELTQGYGVFLHGGNLVPIKPLAASDAAAVEPRKVVDPAVANLVRDILTRHPDRVLTFGRNGNNRLRFDGAMKTGTSNQFNNIWALGFTTDLLGGVWLGNFGGQTVVGTADSGYPAGVMRKMLEAFSEHRPFPVLDGFRQAAVCSLSGMAASAACPHQVMEWFRPGTEPRPCDWHVRSGGGIEIRYPQEYQAWLGRYRYRPSAGYKASELAILRPLDGSVFFMDPGLPLNKQELAIEAMGTGTADLSIDGVPVYRGSFPFKTRHQLGVGDHRILLSNGRESIESEYEVR